MIRQVPDLFEAIVAYRCFDVCPNGILVGQAIVEPWPPYEAFRATCNHINWAAANRHLDENGVFLRPPVDGCSCGIYAYKSQEDAEGRYLDTGSTVFRALYEGPDEKAWGTVKLWGRVIEHETGYRSEYAYPVSLTTKSKELAAAIHKLYGIPCDAVEAERPEADGYFPGLSQLSSLARGAVVGSRQRTVHTLWGGSKVGKSTLIMSSFRQLYNQASGYIPNVLVTPAGISITDPAEDAKDKPMVMMPQAHTVGPRIVGANSWQVRQYGKLMQPPTITQADWRSMLSKMVYRGR